MDPLIQELTKEQLRDDMPDFRAGDTVRVHVRVVEGTHERIQMFEGVVIKRKGAGISATYTVRKMSSGIGVERTFPVNDPRVAKVKFFVTVVYVVLSFTTYVNVMVKQLELLKSVAVNSINQNNIKSYLERDSFFCIKNKSFKNETLNY